MTSEDSPGPGSTTDRHRRTEPRIAAPAGKSVRSILLRGVFWRIIIIEGVLLVWSVGWQAWTQGGEATELVAYALRIITLVGVIVIFMILTLRGFLERRIIEPLEAVAEANRRMGEGFDDGDIELPRETPREVVDIATTRNRMLEHILEVSRERLRLYRFAKKAFGLYVSDAVADQILASPEGPRVGGRRQDVTVLFADLRGFTAMSAHHNPEEMFDLLNRWLARMSTVIEEYGGVINDVLGDEIMTVFGMTGAREDDPLRAVACGLVMQNEILKLNGELRAGGLPSLEMGVGINTGSVLLGNIGSDRRLKYGIVGSAVNTAARIQSSAVGGQVLIGRPTYDLTAGVVEADQHLSVLVKGLNQPLTVRLAKAMGPPFDLKLDNPPPPTAWLELDSPLTWWRIADKRLVEPPGSGKLLKMNDLELVARLDHGRGPAVEELADLKLSIDGRSINHSFDDIYAKVVETGPPAEEGPPVLRLRITSLSDADRETVCRLAVEPGG